MFAGEIGTAIAAVTHAIANHDVGEVTNVHAHPERESGGVILPGIAPVGPLGMDTAGLKEFGKAIGTAMREMQREVDRESWEEGEGA